MKNNIFLEIEHYFVAPSRESSEIIKTLSHELGKTAYEQAKEAFPNNIIISGDDFMPFLRDLILQQAREAYSVSTRLIENANVTENDPAYIFRLSEAQRNVVLKLQNELLDPSSTRRPDGLIFAYVGIIDRRKSQYKYCEGLEAAIRDQNTLLGLKADQLSANGNEKAAKILRDAHGSINELCKHYPQTKNEHSQFMAELTTILTSAKNTPEMKEHKPINTFICNFLFIISVVGVGYLASTANKRGTFWFQPQSDAEYQLVRFVETSQGALATDVFDDDFELEDQQSRPVKQGSCP